MVWIAQGGPGRFTINRERFVSSRLHSDSLFAPMQGCVWIRIALMVVLVAWAETSRVEAEETGDQESDEELDIEEDLDLVQELDSRSDEDLEEEEVKPF